MSVDDDLGRSGTRAEGRQGFQRLVAEVGLDHVGLILGVEMSRLARSSKDWHQLLEICALFGTLIADLDGIYDPSQYNDRLLLGLKIPFLYNTSFTCDRSAAPSVAPASRDSE
jgi:DNA invertase Pin-like site-specific DNA recombinase